MERDLAGELGGARAVRQVVDDLYRRVLADSLLEPYFHEAELVSLAEHVSEAITILLGPEEPSAAVLRKVEHGHAGLAVTDQAFDRLVGHLLDAVADAGADGSSVDLVIQRVAALRPLVV